MSGHSKWSTIKRKKEAADNKRGALFTKLAKELQLAAKAGGPDPDTNFKLRLAVQRAKAANMPNDNITRAIAKATGGGDSDQLIEVSYEGYGPGGAAILVTAVTDNRNRTVAAIRHEFTSVRRQPWRERLRRLAVQIPRRSLRAHQTATTRTRSPWSQSRPAPRIWRRPMARSRSRPPPATSKPSARRSRRRATLSTTPTCRWSPPPPLLLRRALPAQTLRLLDGLEELEDVQRVYSNADFDEELLAQYAG